MSDTREKLFDLMNDSKNPAWWKFISNAEMLKFVDYLIANGVTIATDNSVGDKLTPTADMWIPVSEGFPENDGIYLTYNKKKKYEFHFFQIGKRMWPAIWEEDAVTHWMPLPEPPKGE